MTSPTLMSRYFPFLYALLVILSALATVVGLMATALGFVLLGAKGFEWRFLIGVPMSLVGALAMYAVVRLPYHPISIDLDDGRQIVYMTKRFKISRHELAQATREVGLKTRDIKRYLRDKK